MKRFYLLFSWVVGVQVVILLPREKKKNYYTTRTVFTFLPSLSFAYSLHLSLPRTLARTLSLVYFLSISFSFFLLLFLPLSLSLPLLPLSSLSTSRPIPIRVNKFLFSSSVSLQPISHNANHFLLLRHKFTSPMIFSFFHFPSTVAHSQEISYFTPPTFFRATIFTKHYLIYR